MPPLPHLAGDAYRQYNIGVGDEALGYKAERPASARRYFEAAVIGTQGREANPRRSIFIEPVNRIKSPEHYKQLSVHRSLLPPRQPSRRERESESCGGPYLPLAAAGHAQQGCAGQDLVVRRWNVSASARQGRLSNGLLC